MLILAPESVWRYFTASERAVKITLVALTRGHTTKWLKNGNLVYCSCSADQFLMETSEIFHTTKTTTALFSLAKQRRKSGEQKSISTKSLVSLIAEKKNRNRLK